jgi:hypothetical protein
MGLYVINIGDASAKQWTQLSYEHTLNAMSNCQIGLDGVTSGYSAEFDVDKEIYIYKGGTLKFRGIVTSQEALSGGGIILSASGVELELAESKSPMVGSATTRVWTSTSDHTILSTLVTSVSGWTIDTANSTSEDVDYRTSATESVWNAVINLISQSGKDIWIDQANKVVYLYDEYTRDDQFSFIEGHNAANIRRSKSRSKAGKVIIYGKGDGENQIIGSTGSGTPVYSYIDRNIVSTTEADARALVEYNKLNPQLKSYSFIPIISIDNLKIGDMGNIANNSAGINEEVDIVRIKTKVNTLGIEDIDLEVTNPAYRIASRNEAEERAKGDANYIQSQTSMQGSGNTLGWDKGINAKSGAPFRMSFYLPDDFIIDEAGNIRINSMTLDYDIDPFNSQFGIASETEVAPSLTAGNTINHKHNPADSGHPHGNPTQTSTAATLIALEGSDSFSGTSLSVGWNNNALSEAFSGSFGFLYVRVVLLANFSGSPIIGIRVHYNGSYYINRIVNSNTAISTYLVRETFIIPVLGSISSTMYVDIYTDTNNSYDGWLLLYQDSEQHSHPITSWNTNSANAAVDDNNRNPSLTGNAELHDHSVVIGDDVGEAGSVNATEVDIYLDYWNTGTSTWVNKHSILNTGKTLDQDVDITNSGTYPDAAGWWRVRVEPDSASADFVQGIVKIKHQLDN